MPADLPNITSEWIDKVFRNPALSLEETALQLYQYQYRYNSLYAEYCNAVGKNHRAVKKLTDIPFLPIRFFKTHRVTTGRFEEEIYFESSGTTGSKNSRHYVKNVSVYTHSFTTAFRKFYGMPADWCIIALLPAYLERQHSSLVLMANELIKQSKHPDSGFYLYEHEKLQRLLHDLEKRSQPCLLLGVTFALLDFAENHPLSLQHTVVMETGGMKGRREEWTRQQVHEFLIQQLGISVVHSEYGMTELLSQAYSKGNGIFECPPWMKILVREEDDPFCINSSGQGVINVIDLANIHSCAFVATDDAGKLLPDGCFEVLGRVDNSDIRGCSLMVV
jgi:hypothetical protein